MSAVSADRLRELKELSSKHGLPGIDLAQVVIPLENLQLIPVDIARQHRVIPILLKPDRVFLAMADPSNRRVVDEIEFVSGRKVFPYVALPEALDHVIGEAYQMLERGEDYYLGPNVPAEYLAKIGLSDEDLKEPAPDQSQVVVGDAPLPLDPLEMGVEGDMGSLPPQHTISIPDLDDAPPVLIEREEPLILIVDDEADIRRLLSRLLEEKGYDVEQAEAGLEALKKVRDLSPDLILLDAMLPEVHGFDICRRIKGSKRYGHIPVIMVSAIYRGWRVAQDLKNSYGVDAFLEKPFKISVVMDAVTQALQGSEQNLAESNEISREARSLLERGIASYQNGQLTEAVVHLEQGVAIDPLSFKLHYHLGLLYGRQERIFEGIQSLETAVDLKADDFAALKNLAVLYQRAGFKHKAIEMWERALSSAPDDETKQGIKDHLMSLL